MNHSGSLPPGQPGFSGQPQQQQQQQQQFAGYQQGHQHQQHPQQQHYQQQQSNFGFPSQQVPGGFGYDTSFEHAPQAQPQQFQAQNQWAYYNTNTGNTGYGGNNGGMQMPAQEQYNMAAWQQQQQQQAPRPQQSYHVQSPQMQNAMSIQAQYGNQVQGQQYHHQMQGQQMGHLQQPPRRSPSVSQQQMRQRPSPQVQHQPSPQAQARPSPHMQQQAFAMNASVQQQPQQQHIQHPTYQQMQHQATQHHHPQQAQPSPRVAHQQQPTHTPTPPPPVQQQKPQILQPQARHIQQHQQPQQQQQAHVQPKPDSRLESAPTSFQGQSRGQGQVRPQVPAQTQNQRQNAEELESGTRQAAAPAAHPDSQPQTQRRPQPQPQALSTASQVQPAPTTVSSILQQQQLQPQQPQAPAQEQAQFVNLQDIQAMPRPKPQPPSVPAPVAAPRQTSLQPPAPIKKEKSQSSTPKLPTSGAPAPKKVEKSRKSVSQSPGTPSGRLSTSQSPAVSSKKPPACDASMLSGIAEEFIDKARSGATMIAANPQHNQVDEYHKMISTGLACLDSALHGKNLTPRQEARIRLRLAAVLHEETENITDAETTLSKGITLCDRHRLHDLKYCMQYLMMKILFRRNRKAGLKALDQHIADCETYKHAQWTYAFRLLKFSFYEESKNAADATSVENIRAIQSMASARGDVAMSVYASLTEALVMLKTSKSHPEAIHNCMAQALKHQFDEQAKIPELELLSLLLEVAVGFNRDTHEVLDGRLRELKKRIGKSGVAQNAEFLMPIKRSSSGNQTVSAETAAIICPGKTPQLDQDFLVMKFMTEQQMAVVVFSMCGLHYLHKPHRSQHNTATFWQHGLRVLREYDNAVAFSKKPMIMPLRQAQAQKVWRTQIYCYLNMLLGLLAASQCDWDTVQQFITAVDAVAREGLEGPLKAYYFLLKGSYCQGTGELESALAYFQDDSLSLHVRQTNSAVQQHLAILAGINRIWIMQRPDAQQYWPYENHRLTRDLIDELEPLCSNHYIPEIRTAWYVVVSTAVQDPPLSRNTRKDLMNKALNTSKLSESSFGKLISIVAARDILYTNVMGDQAVKAIQAAGAFSTKSNNPLWQSVVSGIYADWSDSKNERESAQEYFSQGIEKARAAFHRSS